jgi:hypothetical protein
MLCTCPAGPASRDKTVVYRSAADPTSMHTLPGRTRARSPHISLSRYGVHRASEVTADAVSLCRIVVGRPTDIGLLTRFLQRVVRAALTGYSYY